MVVQITERYGISRVFPWLKHLSPADSAEFYTDFFSALEQAIQEKNWTILEQTIESWQATAEVLADAELTTILTEASSSDDLEDWDDVEGTQYAIRSTTWNHLKPTFF